MKKIIKFLMLRNLLLIGLMPLVTSAFSQSSNSYYLSTGFGFGISDFGKEQKIVANSQFGSYRFYQADSQYDISPLICLGGGYSHLLSKRLSLQLGVSLHYLSDLARTGSVSDNGAPSDSAYKYNVTSTIGTTDIGLTYHLQHILQAVYARLSLGAGINNAHNYQRIDPVQSSTKSLAFANHRKTNFVYGIAVGAQIALRPNLLVGPEYQYWNLGEVNLGKGTNFAGASTAAFSGGRLILHSVLLVKLTYLF